MVVITRTQRNKSSVSPQVTSLLCVHGFIMMSPLFKAIFILILNTLPPSLTMQTMARNVTDNKSAKNPSECFRIIRLCIGEIPD